MDAGCSSFVGAAVGGGGGVGVGEAGKAVGVGSGVAVFVGSGVGKEVLVGRDRMNTPPAPSSGLSPAGQAARSRAAAASAAMAPARRFAISRRFYRKGGRGASLVLAAFLPPSSEVS